MAKIKWYDYGPDHPIFSGGIQSFVPAPRPKPQKYFVLIRDLLAPEDRQISSTLEFSTAKEAISAAQKIIDEQLIADFQKNPNDRPLQLLDGLLDFGYMPTLTCSAGSVQFNARAYAERKCYELTGQPLPDKLFWDRPNYP